MFIECLITRFLTQVTVCYCELVSFYACEFFQYHSMLFTFHKFGVSDACKFILCVTGNTKIATLFTYFNKWKYPTPKWCSVKKYLHLSSRQPGSHQLPMQKGQRHISNFPPIQCKQEMLIYTPGHWVWTSVLHLFYNAPQDPNSHKLQYEKVQLAVPIKNKI